MNLCLKQNLLFIYIYHFLIPTSLSLNLAIIYEIVLPVGVFVISPKNHVLIFVDALITRILTCQRQ